MYSDTDAAAAGDAVFVFATTHVVAKIAAVAAATAAAAPAAASVPEEKKSWTLNIISFLIFLT